MTYTRVASGDPGNSGATSAVTIVNAHSSALESLEAGWVNVLDYGAVADAANCNGDIFSGSATFTAASSVFVPGDVGKTIVVAGAGTAGADLVTTISAYTSGTVVTLTASASTTVSGARAVFGTINTTPINNAIAALSDGDVLYFPGGTGAYLTAGGHTIAKQVTVSGEGGQGGYAGAKAPSMILTYGNNVLFTTTAHGMSWRELSLRHYSVADGDGGPTGTKPTAGAGIQITAGGAYSANQAVTVWGFWIGIEIQSGANQRWTDCLFMDSVKYGVKLSHAALPDYGHWGFTGCEWTSAFGASTPDAQVYWTSGSGLRIANCVIAGGVNGVELAPAVTDLSQFLITGTAFEQPATGNAVKVTVATGRYIKNISVVGNSFGHYQSTAPVVSMVGTDTGSIRKVSIVGNMGHMNTGGATAIQLTNATDISIVGNDGIQGATQLVTLTTCTKFDLGKREIVDRVVAGTLSAAADSFRWYNRTGRTVYLKSAWLSVGTAPTGTSGTPITGASLVVDVNKNGTTVFGTQSNRPNILSGGFASSRHTAQIEGTALADGDYITFDVDYVGSTIAGANLIASVEVDG